MHGKTPYELFSFMFGRDIVALLGIDEIAASDVVQTPMLLKSDALLATLSAPIDTDPKPPNGGVPID